MRRRVQCPRRASKQQGVETDQPPVEADAAPLVIAGPGVWVQLRPDLPQDDRHEEPRDRCRRSQREEPVTNGLRRSGRVMRLRTAKTTNSETPSAKVATMTKTLGVIGVFVDPIACETKVNVTSNMVASQAV
jgi:hypothetical protein